MQSMLTRSAVAARQAMSLAAPQGKFIKVPLRYRSYGNLSD